MRGSAQRGAGILLRVLEVKISGEALGSRSALLDNENGLLTARRSNQVSYVKMRLY
jgi:hypothetical protein